MNALDRYLPASLFGRLMLVLAAGLALAQGIGAAINLAERGRLLNSSFAAQPVQRIADVVQLLDSLPTEGRERVLGLFALPPLVVSLHDSASLAETQAAGARGEMFAQRLRGLVGANNSVRVALRDGFAVPAGAMTGGRTSGMGPGMAGGHWRQGASAPGAQHRGMGPSGGPGMGGAGFAGTGAGLAVVRLEVALSDGRWARFDSELPEDQSPVPWRLLLTLGVLLLATLGLSWLAVRWVVRPLRVLAQAAQSLGQDLSRPALPEDGPTEVRQATQAFNAMQRRLASFVNERTQMLSALSHDLKTPLTRMRLRTELLDDETTRERYEADLLEMETMVVQTLDFLRGLDSMGDAGSRSPVDINALLQTIAADQQAMGRQVQVRGQALRPYPGVASLLRRAVGNLVDNAVLYGGSATIEVQDGDDHLVLRVLDEGPGLAPIQLDRVFEPYYRVESSRNRATGGTGLGLTIVRSIARAHGGDAVLRNRAHGGLEAEISLPREAAAPG